VGIGIGLHLVVGCSAIGDIAHLRPLVAGFALLVPGSVSLTIYEIVSV
jgi:hypothetical protein